MNKNIKKKKKNKKNVGGKPQSQKKYNFVLDLPLVVHKRTGLACQSQMSSPQQSVFLTGSQCPRDLFRTET